MFHHPSLNDATKIRLFPESCNIVSCIFIILFVLVTKIQQINGPALVRFSPFGIPF